MYMRWTLELASYLKDAPWPATKNELIDYASDSGAPIEVIENLKDLREEEVYEDMNSIWSGFRYVPDSFLETEQVS